MYCTVDAFFKILGFNIWQYRYNDEYNCTPTNYNKWYIPYSIQYFIKWNKHVDTILVIYTVL